MSDPTPTADPTSADPDLNDIHSDDYDPFYVEPSVPKAVAAGTVAGLVLAGLWAAFSVTTGIQLGLIAIGVGIGVGLAVRTAGNGTTPKFGIIGGVIAGLSVLIGNIWTAFGLIAQQNAVSFIDVLLGFRYSETFILIGEMTGFMDILFYAIAIYEGYKYGIRRLGE